MMITISKVKRLWIGGVVAVLFMSGILCSWWLVHRIDGEMRKDLLKKAEIVAQSLNLNRLQSLSGTPSDRDKPDYLRLKQQLASVAAADGNCRFIYLMGQKDDGRVFFYADNEIPGSEDESPAGQIYSEISAEYLSVFNNKQALTVGPVIDRWGSWVTSLIPIKHPQTDKLLAVLGMDVSAESFRTELAKAAIPPSLTTMALIMIFLVGMKLFSWFRQKGDAVHGELPFWEPMLIATAGLVLTVFFAWQAHQKEVRSHIETFRLLAKDKSAYLMQQFQTLRDIELEGLAQFIEHSREIDADEFQSYTEHLVRNPYIQAWEWIPVVPAAQKENDEMWARGQQMPSGPIWQRDPDGKRVPVENRGVYFPVCFVAPMAENASAIGFDLGSEPFRKAALAEASKTGLVTATAPLTLVQESEKQQAILIYRPVFEGDGRRLRGFALAVLRMGAVFQSAVPDQNVALSLSIVSPESKPVLLASSFDPTHRSMVQGSMTRPILAFGKTFWVEAFPGPHFERNHPKRAGGLVLFSGVALTLALVAVLAMALTRRRQLEKMVAGRTVELEASREQLVRMMERLKLAAQAAQFGVWELDLKTNRLEWDGWMYRLYGVDQDAFAGTVDAWQRSVHPDDLDRVDREMALAISGKNAFDTVFRIVRPDGAIRYIKGYAVVSHDEQGSPVRMTGINYDTTKQRRIEDTLRAEKDLFAAGPVFIIAWSPKESWPVIFVSENVGQIIGYTPEEMTAEPFRYLALIHPEDVTRISREVAGYFESNVPHFALSYRLRNRLGQYRWFYDFTRVIRDDGGVVTAIHGYMFDQTDHKNAEIALRNSHKRTTALMDAVQTGIILVRRSDRIIVEANLVAARMVGCKVEDLVGSICHQTFCPAEVGRCPVFDLGNPVDNEERVLKTTRGTLTPILKTACQVQLEDEAYLLESFVDISRQKETEEQLKNSEENFRSFFESVDDMILVCDTLGKIMHANDAVTRKLGFDVHEIRGKRLLDLHASAVHHEAETILTAMLNGERISCVLPLSHKNGMDIPVETRVWFGKWNNVDCVFGFSKDLTLEWEAQKRFERLFRGNPSPMALSSLPDRRFVDVNDAFLRTLGYDRSEIIGRHAIELHLFVEPEMHTRIIHGIQSEGRVTELEMKVRRKDGTLIDGLFYGEKIINQGLAYFLSVMIDISDQKQMEKTLRENQARLDLALQSADMGTWQWDLSDNKRYFDDKTCHLLGIDPAGFQGTADELFDVVHPDDREMLKDALAITIDQGVPYKPVYRCVWPDNTIHYIAAHGKLIRDDAGQLSKIIGLVSDITEAKRFQQRLEDERQRLANVIQGTQAGTWEWNVQTGETVFNEKWAEIIGYTLDELMPVSIETWMRFAHPEDLQKSNELLQNHFSGGSPYYDCQCRMQHKNGTWVWVHDRGQVVTWTETGAPLKMFGTHMDITKAKQAEKDLLETNRRLEEATARANEMVVEAEMANIAKSEFLANMSHEIRTPMNGVIGMIGLLLDTELSEVQRHYAQTVRASGESLLCLINDILDFSKIEAGKLDLEILDFDLQGLLDDFAATMAIQAQDKGLEMLCGMAPDVPSALRGDPGRLRQILTNLVGNAIKFTREGEVAIRVTMESDDEDGVILRFSVRDTGIGIPDEKWGLLFHKFSQVDASTTRQYGGSGLGLAISKQLAGMMGGDIGVTSKEGAGSEFWFTAGLEKQFSVQVVEDTPLATLDGVRILIVDDNATNREILHTTLTAWGMRVSASEGGPGALQSLYNAIDDNDPFQVAVIDMQMPGMDGATLGRTIKMEERMADTRLVLLTSLGVRGDARHFSDIGFSAYLTKPARTLELKTMLSQVLASRDKNTSKPRPLFTRHTAREDKNLFNGYKVRILLAEDNYTNQQVAMGILEKFGLTADAVANGLEVLTGLASISYDLVLMDVQMPVMDGYEATARIRDPQSKVKNHAIPVIAMTAHAMTGDREKCLEAGMNDYIAKPVSPNALAEVLQKWLPKQGRAVTDITAESKETLPEPRKMMAAMVWNKAAMLDRLMDDVDLAGTIMDGFLWDVPLQIEKLAQFIKNRDAKGIEYQAHTIKGAAANVGGEALQEVALIIEKAGQAGSVDKAGATMAALKRGFDRLAKEIRADLDQNI